jgi:hypothetical protein
LPKTHTSTAPGPKVADSKTTSQPAQALEAFNRLTAQEKTEVLDHIRAAHALKAVQEAEENEFQGFMILAMVLLLLFTICFYIAWAVSISATK